MVISSYLSTHLTIPHDLPAACFIQTYFASACLPACLTHAHLPDTSCLPYSCPPPATACLPYSCPPPCYCLPALLMPTSCYCLPAGCRP